MRIHYRVKSRFGTKFQAVVSCGVSSAAVLLARALGAHCVFTASGKERRARVTALGGAVGVDYRKEDFLAAVMEAAN